jgi:hypothetical protein
MAADEYPETRSGADRRVIPERSKNCEVHESRIDSVDKDINRAKGWMQAAIGFWGVAVVVVGFIGTNINTKLGNIEAMLGNDKSDIRLLNEQVKNLQTDVKEIQDRHREQDKVRFKSVP